MSEPVLVAGSNTKWDVLLGIVLGAGDVVAAAGFWRDLMPASPLLVLAGAALVLVCATVWVVRRVRRRWCVLQPDGFTLRDSGGDEEFHDDDVFAMSLATKKNYSNGVLNSTTRVFTVWLEDGAATRRIPMTTRVKLNEADPLAALVQRISDRLKEEAGRSLAFGHRVEGNGWALEDGALVLPSKSSVETFALSEIAAADIYDRHVCVWRRGSDEPVARIPEHGENAWILLLLLQECAAQQQNDGVPPATGLGRVLFERRPGRYWLWLLLPTAGLLFLGAGACLVGAFVEREPALLFAAVIVGALALFLAVGGIMTRWNVFRCHEYGVHKSAWFRTRELRYVDVEAFTCTANRMYVNGVYSGTQTSLKFEPAAGSDARPIT